jgi:regulator of sigma E protease
MNTNSFISNLPQWALSIAVFLVIISVLVAGHEYGHYLFARIFKMGVEEFAIGFGKPSIWTWKKKDYEIALPAGDSTPVGPIRIESGGSSVEGGMQWRDAEVIERNGQKFQRETTVFNFRPYPFGGFVRIKGMVPQEDGGETQIPGGIYSKPAWQRLIVLFAGPAFSVISGILLLIPVFMLDGIPDINTPVLGGMNKEDSGYKAGLRPDDRVLSIDGKPINQFIDMVKIVRVSGGKTLMFEIERAGEKKQIAVVPTQQKEPSPVLDADMAPTGDTKIQAKIGVQPAGAKRRASFGEAVNEALLTPVKSVQGLARIFSKPQTFTDQMGGPATMLAYTAGAVQAGFSQVIILAALLSISVGIMNLLPIYPLDGGQMAVAIAEMIRGGRRLSLRVQNAIGSIGFVLVLLLFASVFYADFKRFVPGPSKPGAPKIDMTDSNGR